MFFSTHPCWFRKSTESPTVILRNRDSKSSCHLCLHYESSSWDTFDQDHPEHQQWYLAWMHEAGIFLFLQHCMEKSMLVSAYGLPYCQVYPTPTSFNYCPNHQGPASSSPLWNWIHPITWPILHMSAIKADSKTLHPKSPLSPWNPFYYSAQEIYNKILVVFVTSVVRVVQEW